MLEVPPHILDRIEIRRIPRQPFYLEPLCRILRQEVLDQPAAMNGRTVPDHQDVAGDVLQEMFQKAHDGLAAIGPALHAHQELPMLGQGTDGRHMVPRQWDAQDRRLSTWCIGADPRWKQVEARFIYPDDGLLLRGSVFFSAGQRSSHHAAMTASSRWAARTIGFCTLKPQVRSKRLTWAR
jgi:hypothetical protein